MKKITFDGNKKENHFYASRNKNTGRLEKIEEPTIGIEYYEIAFVNGGTIKEEKVSNPTILEISIPLCDEHIKKNGESFGVLTCRGWFYIALSSPLGSNTCRLCKSDLSIPIPYLYNADLSDANLSDANLYNANLKYANLKYANLSNANLYYADLSDANLSDANLYNANLKYANLKYANLSNANLSDANLSNANLYSANLKYANLSNANLSNANLKYANLSNVIYSKYTLGLESLTKEQRELMRKI